jgi:hypothetical protein
MVVVGFRRTGRQLILADRPCTLPSALKGLDCMLALPISPTKAFPGYGEPAARRWGDREPVL